MRGQRFTTPPRYHYPYTSTPHAYAEHDASTERHASSHAHPAPCYLYPNGNGYTLPNLQPYPNGYGYPYP